MKKVVIRIDTKYGDGIRFCATNGYEMVGLSPKESGCDCISFIDTLERDEATINKVDECEFAFKELCTFFGEDESSYNVDRTDPEVVIYMANVSTKAFQEKLNELVFDSTIGFSQERMAAEETMNSQDTLATLFAELSNEHGEFKGNGLGVFEEIQERIKKFVKANKVNEQVWLKATSRWSDLDLDWNDFKFAEQTPADVFKGLIDKDKEVLAQMIMDLRESNSIFKEGLNN